MAQMININMKDFRDIERREQQFLEEWERGRIIKKCKECGQPYSYAKGESDPKGCQRCRGEEGDLVY